MITKGTRRPVPRTIAGVSVALGVLLATTTVHAATLTVTIHDVRSDSGQVRLALYGSAESFSDFSDDIVSRSVDAASGAVTVTFRDLSRGDYAIAVFHDENGNGAFDTGFLGIPKEGYGFSNDAAVFFGPPSFGDAVISVAGEVAETRLSLNY